MSSIDPGLVLVVFGGAGDLARRKLLPALYANFQKKLLPENFAILAIGRSPHTNDSYRDLIKPDLDEQGTESTWLAFAQKLQYVPMNAVHAEEYDRLRDRLTAMHDEYRTGQNTLFYLSTRPDLFAPAVTSLGEMLKQHPPKGWFRVIIEKPFGKDLASAKELTTLISRYFAEDQIFRIDHFLGKETVQNLLVTRFANGFFEPLWNKHFIERVEITSAESLGVEKRGEFYDQTGALRDMVQNHLLQLVGLTAMEPPAAIDPDSIRHETVKVFKSLRPLNVDDITKQVIRGQYTESHVRGEHLNGYRAEPGIKSDSHTETYVAMKFFIDNWRWAGVPFYIRTGKRLPTKVTEVVLHFRPAPLTLFRGHLHSTPPANQLIIRIQPDEGILLNIGMKEPGAGYQVRPAGLEFHYSDVLTQDLPSAYESLLLYAMRGDATLYARTDSVLACWEFVQPIIDCWNSDKKVKMYGYPAGTWGPPAAESLVSELGSWRYPCKNLTSDHTFCEL